MSSSGSARLPSIKCQSASRARTGMGFDPAPELVPYSGNAAAEPALIHGHPLTLRSAWRVTVQQRPIVGGVGGNRLGEGNG